ncbi:carboxypeptidase regulatory-like domain-containing protein [Pseudonocardia bannensis]|uniref:Uncharacterized protein n=1 Tax=Pseudonocardia bannensis TaxID=630973 RepID=A0A848DHG9_9PSEU|nr:carboxypeptidase regulatory-like domain-containing protein [Pseudonocardia bannensis]NMH91944.1 hypothetical protein [Pseudonocardia bannensis]
MTSVLGLIGLGLGVIVVAGLVVLLRKPRPAESAAETAEDPGRPRTVAELVQLRAAAQAEQARSAADPADAEPVTDAIPMEPVAEREPVPAEPVTEPVPTAASAEPATAEPATAEPEAVEPEAVEPEAVEPEAAQVAAIAELPEVSLPAQPRRVEPAAPPAPLLSRDTVSAPWGRVPDGSLTLPAAAPPVLLSAPSDPPAVPAARRRSSGFGDRPAVRSTPVVAAAEAANPEAEASDPRAAGAPDGPTTESAAETPDVIEQEIAEPAPDVRESLGAAEGPTPPPTAIAPVAEAPAAEVAPAPGAPGEVPVPAASAPAEPATDASGPAASGAAEPVTGDWPGWTDWAEFDVDEDDGRADAAPTPPDPTPAFGLAVIPQVVPAEAVAEPSGAAPDGEQDDRPPVVPLSTRESRAAARAAARAAEEAAADVSLLRTLGFADPNPRPGAAAVVSLAAPVPVEPEIDEVSADARPVRFRVARRDGVPVPDAAMTLLDGRGREAGRSVADVDGRGVVAAPRPGGYVLVSSADGHQPGAVALTVDGRPLDVEVLLVGSASVAGTVRAGRRPVDGATVTLLQDGEVVGTVDTGAAGRYRIGDLAAGDYTLAVTSPGHDPVAAVVRVPEQADVEHDVELERPATAAGSAPSDRGDGGADRPH